MLTATGAKNEADHHDHRSGHDRGQDFFEDTAALPSDQQAQQDINNPGCGQSAHGSGDTPGLGAIENGREKGKG